jgi:hypothetical protein
MANRRLQPRLAIRLPFKAHSAAGLIDNCNHTGEGATIHLLADALPVA